MIQYGFVLVFRISQRYQQTLTTVNVILYSANYILSLPCCCNFVSEKPRTSNNDGISDIPMMPAIVNVILHSSSNYQLSLLFQKKRGPQIMIQYGFVLVFRIYQRCQQALTTVNVILHSSNYQFSLLCCCNFVSEKRRTFNNDTILFRTGISDITKMPANSHNC